jgi:molecular chaperone GrpE
MADGLRMVRSQIADVLKSEGISCIEAVGTQFDPKKHDAVMQVELDGYDDNVVVEELQSGYEAEGRVIRPSIVKVNKARG